MHILKKRLRVYPETSLRLKESNMSNSFLNTPVPTPTQNPVPSADIRDHVFGGSKIDEFVTSMSQLYLDRFGVSHYTIEGLRWLAQQSISQYGWIPVGTFQVGATLSTPNQILKDTTDGEYYRWDGSFPKIVPAGSTPNSSGGTGLGKWVSVGDASLRSMLASPADGNGDALIGVKYPAVGGYPRTQHDKNLETVSIKDFGAIGDGVNHPLSERYLTLTSAQSVYPFVTSLSQSIDWAATQAAFNASDAITAPAGKYYISGNVTKKSSPIWFKGDGVGITIFVCDTPSGTIFEHTPTSGDHFFDISDFTVIPAASATGNVTAIHVDGSSQVTTAPYKGMFLTGEREKRRGKIHNIDIVAKDNLRGSTRGVRVTSLLNYSIDPVHDSV